MSESKNHQGKSFRSRRLTLDDYLKVRLEDLSDDDLAKVRNHIILDLMSFLILLFLQQLHASARWERNLRTDFSAEGTGKPRKPT